MPPSSPRTATANSPTSHSWDHLVTQLHPGDWQVLAAVAAEGRLGLSVLRKLDASESEVTRLLKLGMLAAAGTTRPLFIAKDGPTEAAYEIPAQLRQLVLRACHARGELGPVSLRTEELLGARSNAAIERKLQAGSLIFRPGSEGSIPPALRQALTASVVFNFDPQWLLQTWGARSSAVLSLTLDHCLTHALPCNAVYEWLLTQQHYADDSRLAPLVVSMALHRLETERVGSWLARSGMATHLSLLACARFVDGQTGLAEQLLRQALLESAPQLPTSHAWATLVALIALLRLDSSSPHAALPKQNARAFSSWLSPKGASEDDKARRRAFNQLQKQREQPDCAPPRSSPHQLSAAPQLWEVLLHGLNIYAHSDNATLRSAWAYSLAGWGQKYLHDGYLWAGRQALVLACCLDRVAMDRALSQSPHAALPIAAAGLVIQPGDLADLLRARAAWEVSLAALERVSLEASAPSTTKQLEWYVDPVSGSVNLPALLRHENTRGWSVERRLNWLEAKALSEELPEEDRRALRAVPDNEEGLHDFPHLEVFEQLIAHPRVVDAAQGGALIEVTRGRCHIETMEETGHLRVGVRPRGLGPGLNLVRINPTQLSVINVDAAMQAVMQALPQDLVVPHQDSSRVLAVLEKMGDGIPIKSPQLSGQQQDAADTTPVLRFSPLAGAYIVELGVQPFGAEGRFFLAQTGPAVLISSRAGQRVRRERDFAAELWAITQLHAACSVLTERPPEPLPPAPAGDDSSSTPVPAPPASTWILGEADVLRLLREVKESGLACHLHWPERGGLNLAASISVGALRGALRPKKGWYLLSGSVQLDEVTAISIAQLSRLPHVRGGRFLRLPNGSFVAIDSKVRRLTALLAGAKADKSGALQLKSAQVFAIREALEGAAVQLDPELLQRLDAVDATLRQQICAPTELNAELRSYQLEGLRWLYRLSQLGLGACLADDMGLGKTVQILALLLTRPQDARHLVIAPASVCTNWQREMERFAPTLRERLTIMSYGEVVEARDKCAAIAWDTVIADEAQYLKNPKTQRARAVQALPAQLRIAATGTPVENHLGDLWGIFRFLNPDLLGRYSAFAAHFMAPIERESDEEAKEMLQRIVRPFILRREKSQVLKELPPLTRVRHEVRFSDEEASRYALLRRQIHDKLHTPAGKRFNKLEILAEITRLRRYCCHPRLVFPEAPNDSPKLRALIPIVQELVENGHRALVFSQYVDFLDLVRERLHEHGLSYEYLDGSTPKKERQLRVDRFNHGQSGLFLLSLKAGGVGLNLTGADYVLHLDPWWNPATLAQATDRAHRIGQQRPVTVYEIVTQGSIEEDIFRLHKTKSQLSSFLLDDAAQVGQLESDALLQWLRGSVGERDDSGLRLG